MDCGCGNFFAFFDAFDYGFGFFLYFARAKIEILCRLWCWAEKSLGEFLSKEPDVYSMKDVKVRYS
jgi:hypothetical protein